MVIDVQGLLIVTDKTRWLSGFLALASVERGRTMRVAAASASLSADLGARTVSGPQRGACGLAASPLMTPVCSSPGGARLRWSIASEIAACGRPEWEREEANAEVALSRLPPAWLFSL